LLLIKDKKQLSLHHPNLVLQYNHFAIS